MTPQYEIISGSYYLFDQDAEPNRLTKERDIILMTDQVAVCFDRETGTLHKHGNPDRVETWAADTQKKFRDRGFPEMADQIVVVSGNLPLEELNKCLSITGYCKFMYQKLGTLLPADKQAEPAEDTESPRP